MLIVSVKVQAHLQQGAPGSLARCALALPEAFPSSICSTLQTSTQISYLSISCHWSPVIKLNYYPESWCIFCLKWYCMSVWERWQTWFALDSWFGGTWLTPVGCAVSHGTRAVYMALTTTLALCFSISLLLFNYYLWSILNLKKKKKQPRWINAADYCYVCSVALVVGYLFLGCPDK